MSKECLEEGVELGDGVISRSIGTLVAALAALVLLPAVAAGAGSWDAPQALPATAGLEPGSAEVTALPAGDVSLTNVLPRGGSLVTYVQGSRLYALALDAEGAPGARYDISGAGGAVTDVSTEFAYVTEKQGEGADAEEKTVLGRILFAWVSTAPGGSSQVMSGSLAVDGTVGPVVPRSAAATPPDAVEDPAFSLGAAGDLGFTWRQRVGSDWRIALRLFDAEGAAGPVTFASELIGDASEPGIAALIGGGYRVAWIQQTPQGKNIITAGYGADGQLKLYKPVPGASPPNPQDPPHPEYDYSRYALLQPTDSFGPGAVGDPSNLAVWPLANGTVRMTWVRDRTEGGQTRRVVEAASYVDSSLYWVDRRPTEETPPLPPVDNTLPITRLTSMAQAVSELSIVPSGTGTRLVAYRVVQDGKSWLMGGTIKGDGALSIRVRDQHDAAGPGSRPRVGINSRGAAALAWTEPAAPPAGTGAWAAYTPFRGSVVPAMPLDPSGASSAAVGALVNEEGTPLVLTESSEGGSPVLRVSRYFDPRVDLLTPEVRFGTQRIGRSYTAPVYLTNRGISRSTINGLSFGGNDGQFSLADPNACVGGLAAGAVCAVTVRFTPTVEGPATATLTVDSSEGPREVSVSGAGRTVKSLSLRLTKRSFKVRPGRSIRLGATVTATGGAAVSRIRLCVSGWRKAVRPARRCARLDSIGPSTSISRRFRFKVRRNAKKGLRWLKVTVKGDGALDRRKMVRLRVR